MRLLILVLWVGVVLILATGVQATIRHVPSDYLTIQAGIDAALEGDTVLVADGLYTGPGNRDLDFNGTNLLVTSENGPAVTVIDCEGSLSDPHRGFIFRSGEDSTSVVRGFRILRGYAYGAWPENCGGGIYCYLASPTIVENWITDNTACHSGGAVYSFHGSASLVDNVISGNTAYGVGGAIFCDWYPRFTIEGNTIMANTGSSGGAIVCSHCSARIVDNLIKWNTATVGAGGGILSWSSSPLIIENLITENTGVEGGAICCEDPSIPAVEHNLIANNTAAEKGGAILCVSSSPSLDGNTVTENEAAQGGGISCRGYSVVTIVNTILWGDHASSDPEIHVQGEASVSATYSDVAGGWSGEGNIDADPLFVPGPRGDYYLSQMESGQPWQSPCVDAGDTTSAVPERTTRTDENCDGWPVDMGYHYPGCLMLVDEQTEVTASRASCYLGQNYPNPFGSSTTIAYALAVPSEVTIAVYDIRGALVQTLVSECAGAGRHVAVWDGRNQGGRSAASGVYFCCLSTERHTRTIRMVLLH